VADKILVNVQAAPTANQAPEGEDDSDDAPEDGAPEAGAAGGMYLELDTKLLLPRVPRFHPAEANAH
jgi:hypothetical protein